MSYFDELHEELKLYLEADEIEKCHQAYLVAEKGHQGQTRRSGEPYISHPVAAALILAECAWIIKPSWLLYCTMWLRIPKPIKKNCSTIWGRGCYAG